MISRLMQFQEIIAVYCMNHPEHRSTQDMGRMQSLGMLKQVVNIITTMHLRVNYFPDNCSNTQEMQPLPQYCM
jgi:hypothetical protein